LVVAPHRVFFTATIAITASACSFLAFDDYTSEPSPASSNAEGGAPDATVPDVLSASTDAGTEASPSSDPYGDAIRADGPVAWYRFEEDALANAAKDSAGSLTADLRGGGMGFGAQGISGRGIASDGTGAGFTLGYNLGFAGPTSFSLEAWVKPKAGKEHYLFDRRTNVDGSLSGWILYVSPDGTPHFENWGTSLAAWSDNPIPSGYVHLVVTVAFNGNAGSTKLWVNGQPQEHANNNPDTATADQGTALKFLSVFEGEADEIAFYDKALTAERVLAHYLAGKP
jgi:hypothetical protein